MEARERRDARAPLGSLSILGIALLVGLIEQVGRFLPAQWPRRHLDVSWMMGLELARMDGLRHGSELVFSYGPWGFLSGPTTLDRSDLFLAGGFRVLAVGAVFLALSSALRGIRGAMPLAVVLALLVANGSQSGWLLLLALAVWALGSLINRDDPAVRQLAAAAALAALLSQMKLSEGVLALILLGLLTVGRRRWIAGGVTLAIYLVSFAMWWLAAGQALSDIPRWLRLGREIVTGYADAMAYVNTNSFMIALTLIMVIGLVVAALLALTGAGMDWLARLAVLGTLLFGAKVTLSRPDVPHLEPGYALVVVILALLLGTVARGALRVGTVGVVIACLCVLLTAGSPLVRDQEASFGASQFDVLTSKHVDNLEDARAALIAELDVSSTVLSALEGHPVSIDPWEISAAWAYGLQWQPMPIFQQYKPYTRLLDRTNARALLADPDHRVLREREHEGSRNPVWETPAYTLALVCNFTVLASDPNWSAYGRAENRCGAEESLSSVGVAAGEVVRLPESGEALVAVRFVPDARGWGDRVLGLTGVQRHLLHATLDGTQHRLPEALAGGPLIVGAPVAEPVLFDLESASSISFDRAGELEIVEIPLGPQ